MISFINFEKDNIIGIRVSGKITDREYEAIFNKVNERLKKYPKLNLYTELENFEGTSIENYFKDLKFGISNWNRFEKSAVVTEKKWIKKLAPITDKLFSNVKMKAFFLEERELAKEWVQIP